MFKHDISLYISIFVLTFLTPELDPYALKVMIFAGVIDSNLELDKIADAPFLWLYGAKVMMTSLAVIAISLITRAVGYFFRKPLLLVSERVDQLVDRYGEIDGSDKIGEESLKLILSEVRSIFCKFYRTNEISITLFQVAKKGKDQLVAQSYLHVTEDGFVGLARTASVFEEGKGFCGISLQKNASKFGRKKIWLGLRTNPEYLAIKTRDNSKAYSFWCFPIHNGGYERENILYIIAIETSRMKYFDYFAQRDESHQNISHKLDNLIGNVYNCIHNEK